MSIRYIGKNGLEYLTAFDAEKYGEGLDKTIEHVPPKVIHHNQDQKPEYDTLKTLEESQTPVTIPTVESLEKKEDDTPLDKDTEEFFARLEASTDAVLQEIAKSMELRGYNAMKRETLLRRIKAKTLEEKSLA